MLFDEKIGGTVHMAIGDSMPEAGGKNKSSLHWDMLCDMRMVEEYMQMESFSMKMESLKRNIRKI